MLGEADGIRGLNQKPSVLSISIKAGMNSGKKGLWLDFLGGEADEGETERIEEYKQIRPQDLLTFASPSEEANVLSF